MKYANQICYTDINPFKVTRVISDKTLEIRAMKYEKDFTPSFIPGGFFAHCTNNTESEQKWIITSDENREIIRIRKNKHGIWRDKYGNKYSLGDEPRRFHDYNF